VKQKTVGSMASDVAQGKSDKISFVSCNFFFSSYGHFSLLVGPINRTKGVLG
jgi:hypothetical protein